MLEKTGLDAAALECGVHWPYLDEATRALWPETISFMFGRHNSLQELIRGQREEFQGQHQSLQGLIRGQHQSLQGMIHSQRESLQGMIRGQHESLQELIRSQHEETMLYLRQREEEMRREWEATREFNREILLRNEKVYTSMIVQLEENTEQTRANTRAVLSMLDRLDGPGGIAAA